MLIFTDGSHSLKPRMSGLGAVIIHNNHEISIGGYSTDCRDNNVAEMAAIAMACKFVKENNYKAKTISIISDSETALRKITRGAFGQDDYEQKCLDYIRDFIIENPKVNFMQVKGHQTDKNKLSYYNRMADAIAGDYRKMGLELERTKPSKRKIKKFKKSNMTNYEPFNIKKHSGWEK